MTTEVTAPGPVISLLGVRHHGPGSARAVARELAELKPDVILIEGPPEAGALAGLAASPGLVPPVALLAYPVKDTGDIDGASFWPFAVFSPEWQALRYAAEGDVPVRFCDLPAANMLAMRARRTAGDPVSADPLGALAAAAGYDDAERWWDDVIEHRRDGDSPFPAIAGAMAALREASREDAPETDEPGYDDIREAHMRGVLRTAIADGYERIAVVCGAWHVPALTAPLPKPSADAKLLRGLPKVPVEMTWVPWTHGRLASAQGYGAGVESPGWYHHLFTAPDRVVERWLVGVATMLRDEDLPVSSAHVIEAVRLADTLAILRGRPAPGLSEVTEAVRAVLCDGDSARLALVGERLVVGDKLGAVPEDAPAVPLARDVAAAQKRLGLAPSALAEQIDLDLRKPVHLERSRLLHRLGMLGVGWGRPASAARSGKGTWWESWELRWAPELAVSLIEASAYGTTVRAAACAKAAENAGKAAQLADVTAVVEQCLLADLPDALGPVLAALRDRVALDADVAHLMDSVPALTRSLRYGDVRGTGTEGLGDVVQGIMTRICVGLPGALAGMDAAAATEMVKRIDAVHSALAVLATGERVPGDSTGGDGPTGGTNGTDGTGGSGDAGSGSAEVRSGPGQGASGPGQGGSGPGQGGSGPGQGGSGPGQGGSDGMRASWLDALASAEARDDLHGLLAGRLCRLLRDETRLATGDIAARMSRAMSPGVPAIDAAAWAEGFLSGGGLLLVHDAGLFALVDAWLTGIPADMFTDVLPLLRRTFATFEAPERRSIGERAKRAASSADGTGAVLATNARPALENGDPGYDTERAARVLPVLGLLLGDGGQA